MARRACPDTRTGGRRQRQDHKPRAEGIYTATIYPGPQGNFVFNAATIWWADGLSQPPGYVRPAVYTRPQGPDPRVQRITRNLLEEMPRTPGMIRAPDRSPRELSNRGPPYLSSANGTREKADNSAAAASPPHRKHNPPTARKLWANHGLSIDAERHFVQGQHLDGAIEACPA